MDLKFHLGPETFTLKDWEDEKQSSKGVERIKRLTPLLFSHPFWAEIFEGETLIGSIRGLSHLSQIQVMDCGADSTKEPGPAVVIHKKEKNWALFNAKNSIEVSFSENKGLGFITSPMMSKILSHYGFFDQEVAPLELHSLYFHKKTRITNGVFPVIPGKIVQAPKKEMLPKKFIPLDHSHEEPKLFQKQLKRRSFDPKITPEGVLEKSQLESLLYWSLRNINDPSFPNGFRRLYPSAGGFFELDLCILINQVKGIDPGLYLYDSATHSLSLLESSHPSLIVTTQALKNLTQLPTSPHAVLLTTWNLFQSHAKYQDIEYRLALLNAGVLLQHLASWCQEFKIGFRPSGTGSSSNDVFLNPGTMVIQEMLLYGTTGYTN